MPRMNLKNAAFASFLLLFAGAFSAVPHDSLYAQSKSITVQKSGPVADNHPKADDPPAPKPDPVVKIQMPSIVNAGIPFMITSRGTIGDKRRSQFVPELPPNASVSEMIDKRSNSDTWLITIPESTPAGQYTFVYIATTDGKEPALGVGTFLLKSGYVPPGPGPGPGPKPPEPNPDNPAPIPVAGFRVLVIEESEKRSELPAGQANIIQGNKVRDYLNSKCIRDSDANNWPAYRFYDKDVNVDAELKWIQDAMKRPRKKSDGTPDPTLPWLIVSNGVTGWEGPLPANPDEFIKLCSQYEPK